MHPDGDRRRYAGTQIDRRRDVLNLLTLAIWRVDVLFKGDDVHDLGEGIGRDLRVQKMTSALDRTGLPEALLIRLPIRLAIR
ncbi:hypothetical protein [Cryobacterium glucosi]|uniref:hypothetical protein n=1 Tax=Cryobacterium glucosi TaxID=1259175 RepID=UPI00106B8DA9|nr:hypothetical protein [Cryobacterium glucosi]